MKRLSLNGSIKIEYFFNVLIKRKMCWGGEFFLRTIENTQPLVQSILKEQ